MPPTLSVLPVSSFFENSGRANPVAELRSLEELNSPIHLCGKTYLQYQRVVYKLTASYYDTLKFFSLTNSLFIKHIKC
jgi:hypothetical protein